MVRRNKYGATKVNYDGHKFDSKLEYNRYLFLKDQEKQGVIENVFVHPKYEIVIHGDHGVANWKYSADFSYFLPNGQFVVEDVKSPPTAKKTDYKRNVKLMKALHGIDVITVFSPTAPIK